jgi:putative two-component system response regulator
LLGFTPEEWVADSSLWIERVYRDDRENVLAEEERSRLTCEPFSSEYRMTARDGSVVWVRDEAVVLNEAHAPIFQGVMYEITDQKRAAEAIKNQSEILERTVRERTRDLEASRIETLQRLALAAEYRDDETQKHTERVGRTAARLAEQIGLSRERVARIRRAAPLHDIGKIGVSDSILLKKGKLNRREWGLMQQHTTIGAKILEGSRSETLKLGEEIALTHHEHWDGNGYPRALAGADIPLDGRLVAIADVFDALTHTRPYKEAWPLADAVAEILRLDGTHFDPELVAAFASLDHQALQTGTSRSPHKTLKPRAATVKPL